MKKRINILVIFVIIFSFSFSSTIIRSMVVPGWGESVEFKMHPKEYIKKRSNTLLLIEGVVLLSYVTTTSLRDSYEEDYKSYGITHADINWSGKDDIYAINVSKFIDMDAYNTFKLATDPTDVYLPNQGYEWNWNGDESKRRKFKDIRDTSAQLDDFTSLMVAGLIINRLVSVFDIINIKKNEGDFFSFEVNSDNSRKLSINFNF